MTATASLDGSVTNTVPYPLPKPKKQLKPSNLAEYSVCPVLPAGAHLQGEGCGGPDSANTYSGLVGYWSLLSCCLTFDPYIESME